MVPPWTSTLTRTGESPGTLGPLAEGTELDWRRVSKKRMDEPCPIIMELLAECGARLRTPRGVVLLNYQAVPQRGNSSVVVSRQHSQNMRKRVEGGFGLA